MLVHADETSWNQGAELLWLWVFTSATTTRYTIGRCISDSTRNTQGLRTFALLAMSSTPAANAPSRLGRSCLLPTHNQTAGAERKT